MSYFVPHIDDFGVHIPTYEDRLSNLQNGFRSIFGNECELSESVQDYQLLSVFSRALDDVSALSVKCYNASNPNYAIGNDLSALMPMYGLSRLPGETDAAARHRISIAMQAKNIASIDKAILSIPRVYDARVYINDSSETDTDGLLPHSMRVVMGDYAHVDETLDALAETIFTKKPPGIGLMGSESRVYVDEYGFSHDVYYVNYTPAFFYAYIFVRELPGCDRDVVTSSIKNAVRAYVDAEGKIGTPLNVSRLYGSIYTYNPGIANTFMLTDVQAYFLEMTSIVRTVLPVEWDHKPVCLADLSSVLIYWNE